MSVVENTPDLIRSARFRAEREEDWRRLSALTMQVEKRGLGSLSFAESLALSTLYRQTMNALSLAREISLDRALLDYLENLCTRAYLAVYAPRETMAGIVGRYFRTSAPKAVRRSWLMILIAALLMAAGAVSAFLLTTADPSWYYAFVPQGLAGGRGPGASEAYLREVLEGTNKAGIGSLAAFSTSLFAHNTQVSIFSFALGIIAGVPSGFLMFYNGTVLGAFFAIHEAKGLSWELFGWLSIHGVTELTAIIMAAAGGFRLGAAFLFPGSRTRGNALRHAGRDAIKLAILAAIMLVVAGLLEGFGRQLITDFTTRVAVGWGIGALWLLWLLLGGRKRPEGPAP